MVLVIVILVLLLTMAFFHLKCSMMQSFMTLWSAVLATIIAFSYYEWLAEFLISRGHGLDWALVGCFTLLFIVAFAVLRSILDFLVPSSIDLGNMVKLSISLICGLLTGLIVSGNLLVALGLLPMHGKVFYSQFDPDAPVVLDSPRTSALADKYVTGLYSLISSGSMKSKNSFGVFHADYLSQIHLNKLKTKDKVLSVCSREALVLPEGKNKKPVRRETVDDKEIMIVRVGIQAKKIADGGANNASGKVEFFPAQIRIIVKEANATNKDELLTGTAEPLYPVGLWESGKVTKWKLNEIITPDSKKLKNRVYWMDVAFWIPEEMEAGKMKPVLLEFKQTAVVDLTPYGAVKNTPEIERSLDIEGQKEESL